MEDNVLPFGMLASFNEKFPYQSTRRYFGMKGVSDRYNRMLIPQTRRVFFLKQYLPSLIALDIKEEKRWSDKKTAEAVRKIEAFCCWYSIRKSGNTALTKGNKNLESILKQDFHGVPSAGNLEEAYNKVTFSQSCGQSLYELKLTTNRVVKNALMTNDGRKILSLYFEDPTGKDQIEEALQDWINRKPEKINKLLKEGALKILNFNEDVRKELKDQFMGIIKPEVVQWFGRITAKDNFRERAFEKFKELAGTSSELQKLAEKVNAFFVFSKSCKVLADLMESERQNSNGVSFEEFSRKYSALIEITRNHANDFLEKNKEECKCALAFDVLNADKVQILRTIMERNERKGLTFVISDDRVLPIVNINPQEDYLEEERKDEEMNELSFGNCDLETLIEYLKNLNNFIQIPQVYSFYKLQLPWSSKDGFKKVREGIAIEKFKKA